MEESENALRNQNAKLKKVPEFYGSLPDWWKEFILKLFNRVLDTKETPESWSKILVSMLLKKGEVTNPDNNRPIALADALVKLFTFMLNLRLMQLVEARIILPEFQNGFRKAKGCIDNILTWNHVKLVGGGSFYPWGRKGPPGVKKGSLW